MSTIKGTVQPSLYDADGNVARWEATPKIETVFYDPVELAGRGCVVDRSAWLRAGYRLEVRPDPEHFPSTPNANAART